MTKVIVQENKFTHLSDVTNICPIVLLFIYHHVIQIVVQDQWLRLASHFNFCSYEQLHISISSYGDSDSNDITVSIVSYIVTVSNASS